jgi:hypothetical protein
MRQFLHQTKPEISARRSHQAAAKTIGGRIESAPSQPIQAKPMFRGLSQELLPLTGQTGSRLKAHSREMGGRESVNGLQPQLSPLHQANGGGQKLPEAVQQKMEASFGTAFSDVRIHEGAEAEKIGAIAYTCGSYIHFSPGKYTPFNPIGQQLLGHELTHVIQQRADRVKPKGDIMGLPINEDPTLEKEADEMGERVIRGDHDSMSASKWSQRIAPAPQNAQRNGSSSFVVQAMSTKEKGQLKKALNHYAKTLKIADIKKLKHAVSQAVAVALQATDDQDALAIGKTVINNRLQDAEVRTEKNGVEKTRALIEEEQKIAALKGDEVNQEEQAQSTLRNDNHRSAQIHHLSQEKEQRDDNLLSFKDLPEGPVTVYRMEVVDQQYDEDRPKWSHVHLTSTNWNQPNKDQSQQNAYIYLPKAKSEYSKDHPVELPMQSQGSKPQELTELESAARFLQNPHEQGRNDVFINFGNPKRALELYDQKTQNEPEKRFQILSWRIPHSTWATLRKAAVHENDAKRFPTRPYNVDRKAPNQLGLRQRHVELLNKTAMPGSAKVEDPEMLRHQLNASKQ